MSWVMWARTTRQAYLPAYGEGTAGSVYEDLASVSQPPGSKLLQGDLDVDEVRDIGARHRTVVPGCSKA